jgi:hypothetical protein
MRLKDELPQAKSGSHDSTEYTHPAFGQIGASRVSGQTTLYGSDFTHQHFVTVTIRRSILHRDLARDWEMGSDELIEVALSEAQWATFVSSMNVGMGVPCTIQHIAGKGMIPGIPPRQQSDVFKGEVREALDDAIRALDVQMKKIEGELGASLSQTKRAAIIEGIRRAKAKLESTIPFIVKQADEHMEETIEKAKVEVNAYVESTIRRAGLEAIDATKGLLRLGAGGANATE